MPVAFDTNILAYASGVGQSTADRAKEGLAEALLADVLATSQPVIPIQVAFELHNLLVRKRGHSREVAAQIVQDYLDGALAVPSDVALLETAFDLAQTHKIQTYDAVILAAAAHAGCEILYSEDMQHGFAWGGVAVINPFI